MWISYYDLKINLAYLLIHFALVSYRAEILVFVTKKYFDQNKMGFKK